MKIFKDSIIYLSGELIAKILPFLLLPYLSRKLGVAGFGELSFYQTLNALFVIVFTMSQDGALTRYYYHYGKRNLSTMLIVAYSYIMIVSSLSLIIAYFLHSIVLMAVICAAASQAVLNTQLSLRQCQKQAISYTIIQIGSGLSTTLLTVLLLEYTHNFPIEKRFAALFLGNATVSLIALMSYQIKNKKPFQFRGKSILLSANYLLGFGLPLLPHQIGLFIKGQVDRIFIFEHFSKTELGIYSAAYQIASVLGVILMAVNKATVPYFYQALKSKRIYAKTIRCWALFGLLFAFIPAMIGVIVPEKWILWIIGKQFIHIKYYTITFLIGFGLTIPYYLLVNYLFYYGKNKIIATISLFSSGCYLLILFFTIQLGMNYLPLAMIGANIIILPILYWQVKEKT